MESILNVTVSGYSTFAAEPKDVNLLSYLKSTKYRAAVDEIRKEEEPAKRKALKEYLPGITPSGRFTERKEAGLIEHSGLIQFDIDFKENKHITNFAQLKEQICKISSVAYCGLSVSGAGFWGLVPIADRSKHKQHFKALQQAFLNFGIILDAAPSNPASFRYYSYDEEPYFNHSAQPLKAFYTPPAYVPTAYRQSVDDNERKVQACISEIERTCTDITKNCSQTEWAAIGYSLAAVFEETGRDYFHRVSQYHPTYSPKETDSVYRSCLGGKKGDIGTFFKRCLDSGIKYMDSTLFSEKQKEPTQKPYKSYTHVVSAPAELPRVSEVTLIPEEEQEQVEFYNQTFSELCDALGYDKAIEKVNYYLFLSGKHSECSTFIIHTCTLLSTFKQSKAA
ncbi:BT4734/BF3469 family protein [Rufibacter sp. XAAS-G3-1]|uniref:PriCT-2 domain-containing protein n=1 Tax=Rufibacter sp. XAAS-G3-1 TaxID=2729134 RepID=UPI0015E6FDE5|nr:BT4734/BF3469 family protein [Rufibacter sp. XAAS-G3-1]